MRFGFGCPPARSPPHTWVPGDTHTAWSFPRCPEPSPEPGVGLGQGHTRSTCLHGDQAGGSQVPRPLPGPLRQPHGKAITASALPESEEGKSKPGRFRQPGCHSCCRCLGWAGRKWGAPSDAQGPGGQGGSPHHRALPPGASGPSPSLCPGGAVESQTQVLGGLRTHVHMCERVTSPAWALCCPASRRHAKTVRPVPLSACAQNADTVPAIDTVPTTTRNPP